MAIVYCWSGATGLADGTSWTDAYATISAAVTGASSGDDIYLADDHYEDVSVNQVIAIAGSRTISVDRADDSYKPATSVQLYSASGDISFSYGRIFGVWSKAGDDFSGLYSCGYDCTFELSGSSDRFGATNSKFINCKFIGVSTAYISGGSNAFVGCEFVSFAYTSGINGGNFNRYTGCDFSSISASVPLCNVGSVGNTYEQCGLNTSAVLMGSLPTGINYMWPNILSNSDESGVGKAYRNELWSIHGTSKSDTAIYRDSGWSDADGDTPLSHKMTPSSSCDPGHPLYGLPLMAYIPATGSKTLTVHVAENFTTALTDLDAWIELLYLGAANSTEWSYVTSRGADILASGTTLTSSAETWTGASGYTKAKLAKTVTVNKVGLYRVTVYLSKYEASKVLAYCPLVEVS